MTTRMILRERCAPRLEAVLFAERGEISDGKVTLCGIFNAITVDPKSIGAPGAVTCSLFVRTIETVEEPIQITLLDPKGGVVLEGPGDDPAWLVDSTPWPRHVESLRRIDFKPVEEGRYLVEVTYKGQSLGGSHLIIEFGEPEAPTFH